MPQIRTIVSLQQLVYNSYILHTVFTRSSHVTTDLLEYTTPVVVKYVLHGGVLRYRNI